MRNDTTPLLGDYKRNKKHEPYNFKGGGGGGGDKAKKVEHTTILLK
jgi:hypothetical protein